MTAEQVNGLRGNGPWSVADVIDHLVSTGDRLAATNKGLKN